MFKLDKKMSYSILIFPLAFIMILTINCSKIKGQVDTEFNLHNADLFNQLDYDIYNLILEKYYTDSAIIIIRQKVDYNLGPIIYNSDYSSSDYYDYIKLNMPEVDTIAFLNFLSINDSIGYLDNLFKVSNKTIRLFSEDEYDYFFDRDKDTWTIFYEKYPNSNGLIELSRIGFNNEINQAILEIWHSIGWKGSRGIMYFLSKIEEEWIVTNTKETREN